MRIAIVRGPVLMPWETQNFEPWLNRHKVVCFCSTENFYDTSNIKIPIKRLPPLNGDIEQMEGLEEELKDFDIAFTYDIFWRSSAQAVKVKAKSSCKIKVVVFEIENIPFMYEKNPMNINAGMLESALRTDTRATSREGADFFICITERAREALLLEGVPEKKLKVILRGVDTKAFKPRPKLDITTLNSFGIDKDDLVVFFNGRYKWEKGVYELIYAIKRLVDDPKIDEGRLKFLLLGNGQEWEGMKWLIEKLNVAPFIRLLTKVPYHLLPEVYNLADIFALPNIPLRHIREQDNMAVKEAMASGLAVVSTYCGSTSESIGDAGLLVEPADHFSLYQALKRLILDEPLRKEFGRKARRRAEQVLNAEVCAAEIEKVFKSLLTTE
ncbi:glycosyltransferase family 4 protein [bacterium]|nr:glycosyltransferase family 4 protein [bacterium]MBU1615289.1 glycosyltransferase family 4 protein [bacterium]